MQVSEHPSYGIPILVFLVHDWRLGKHKRFIIETPFFGSPADSPYMCCLVNRLTAVSSFDIDHALRAAKQVVVRCRRLISLCYLRAF